MSEQRKHQRYNATDDTPAFADGSRCRIVDISKGGMAVRWVDNMSLPGDGMVTFLCSSKDVSINDLPVRFLSLRNELTSSMSNFKIQSTGIRFNYADTAQQNQVKEYITELAANRHQDFKDN